MLNHKKEEMQEAAVKALVGQKDSLEQQQALKLHALQQQHAAELQTLQALATERRARIQNDLDTTAVSCFDPLLLTSCMLPAAHAISTCYLVGLPPWHSIASAMSHCMSFCCDHMQELLRCCSMHEVLRRTLA